VSENEAAGVDLFSNALVHSYVEEDPRFVERPWLADLIEEKLVDPGCRFLLLTGEPGSGKTALLAWLARRSPDRPRYFIRRDSQAPLNSGDARSLLFALGHQLAALRPGLFHPEKLEVVVRQRVGAVARKGRVVGIKVEDLEVSPFYETALRVEQEAGLVAGELAGISVGRLVAEERLLELANLQYLALLDPAELLLRSDPEARLVILIDALDELRYQPAGESTLDWLAACPELPANVRLVLTSRPDERLLELFRRRQQEWLREAAIDSDTAAVESDLGRYTISFAAEPEVARALAVHKVAPKDFTAAAVARAEGNFQYLAAVFRGIEHALERQGEAADGGDEERPEQLRQLLMFQHVPRGLEELYAFFLALIRNAVGDMHLEVRGANLGERVILLAWEGLYLPVLGVLAVSEEALSSEQIGRLSGTVDRGFAVVLERLGQFLDQTPAGRYRLYHATLPEFLTSPSTRDAHPDLYVDPIAWHERIAASYRGTVPSWDQVDWRAVDDYGLLHLARHLYALRHVPSLRAELFALICASFMREKRRRFGSHHLFAADVSLAMEVARAQEPRDVLEEIRFDLILASFGSVSTEVPYETLGMLARLGRASEARGLAALRRNTFGGQTRAYATIIDGLLEAGDSKQALAVLDDAVASSRSTRFAQMHTTQLASAAARLGEFDRALEMLDSMKDVRPKADALAGMANYLATAGLEKAVLERAEAILDECEPGEQGWAAASTLRALTVAFREAGQKGRAAQTARSAADAARAERGVELDHGALREASLAMAAAGEAGRAVEIATRLAEGRARDEPNEAADALLSVAEALLADGRTIEASNLARLAAMTGAGIVEEARAVALVLSAGIDAQRSRRVVDLAGRLLEPAESLSWGPRAAASALRSLASPLEAIGKEEMLIRAANLPLAQASTERDGQRRAEVAATIAGALAEVGEESAARKALDYALALTESITPSGIEVAARASLARVLAEHGHRASSARITRILLPQAAAIREQWQRAEGFASLARAMAALDDRKGASQTARRAMAEAKAFGARSSDAQALAAIRAALASTAQALERVGHHTAAMRAFTRAQESKGISHREWGALAEAAAAVGEIGEARAIGERAILGGTQRRDPEIGARLLCEAAIALAAAGDREESIGASQAALEEAKRAADTLGAANDRWRIYVLGRAAHALTACERDDLALPVLLEAFGVSPAVGRQFFFEALQHGAPTLARALGPEALERIDETLGDLDGWWTTVLELSTGVDRDGLTASSGGVAGPRGCGIAVRSIRASR
jgi:hypothetical protein